MKQSHYLFAGSLLIAGAIEGQSVNAPFAQHLVTATMSAHPELQKMGLHAIAPGAQDDTIIACSVPSKVGKKSSPGDLAVEQTKKATAKAVTDGSFYDLALPLSDASHRPIGMMVAEMRLSEATSAEDALAKTESIAKGLEKQIPNLNALFAAAPASDPLVLLNTTKLPDITGDFDHFAVDLKHNRLFVSAEVHHSIEVFDLRTGEHLRSAPGVTTPHTIAFVPETNQLLVADGGDASCRILDGTDLHQVKRIALEAGPDAAYYDSVNRLFYVGNSGRGAKTDFSYITIISVDKADIVGKIRVESANLEAMALDREANLLYVNMRDKAQIGVIDLASKQVRQTWTVPDLKLNTPMAFDAANHRLFVVGRKPGKFFTVDTQTGKRVAVLDTVEIADDMTFDPEAKRIYITGSGGVSVFQQKSADQYERIAQFGTNGGKTSVYVSSLKQFYIIHTKTPEDIAGLQVYKVN